MENKHARENTIKCIKELTELSLRINIKTDYCVFVSMAGHVGSIKFTIAKGKRDYNCTLREYEIYYQETSFICFRYSQEMVDSAKKYMTSLLVDQSG